MVFKQQISNKAVSRKPINHHAVNAGFIKNYKPFTTWRMNVQLINYIHTFDLDNLISQKKRDEQKNVFDSLSVR